MNPLDFLLPQPEFDLTPEKQVEFEIQIDATPAGGLIDYRLNYHKWQFLSYLCRSRNLVLHGSQNPDIAEVQPRKARDVRAFSDQNAIYATTDGIWVIYFAIVDRTIFSPLSLFNSCLNIQVTPDQTIGPLYFFSITHSALLQKPWCEGTIYILPRETFEQEPSHPMLGADIIFPHWISYLPAQPVARLHVQPEDFPFLPQVHGHDDAKLGQLAAENPDGFPWPEALIS